MSDSSPILTVTVNPALDVSTDVEAMAPTHKLRCSPPRTDPGGGGINVSRVCHRLGEPTTAVVAHGGPRGEEIQHLLSTAAIPTRVVPIDEDTRESITVVERTTGDQYRFVFPGPALSGVGATACLDAARDGAAGSRVAVVPL